jgi:hypothetical protein
MKSILKEGFEVGDLREVLQPWIHVDEYKSKMGRDDKNCVVSFALDDRQAAQDLVDFLERGYDYVLDADISNSEVSVNRYLVFLELPRRTTLYERISRILSDLRAASDIDPTTWRFKYMKEKDYRPFTQDEFDQVVALSPRTYRKRYQKPIDDMKTAAGLPVSTPPVEDEDLKQLQNLAGI